MSLGRSPGPGSATQRDTSLDLLRVVGILVIFLVHGRPPGWVVQAVGFAVVLLVLASGMSHRLLLERQGLRPTAFLWRRLSRLVLPVWLFLAVYAAGTWLVTLALDRPFPWSREELLETAFLGDGFGYVWIFRIYALLALLTLPLLALARRVASPLRWGALGLGVLVAMEFVSPWALAHDLSESGEEWLRLVVLAAPAYAALFAHGLRLHEWGRRGLLGAALLGLLLFAGFTAWAMARPEGYQPPRAFKYPPRLYYLSWGLVVSHLLVLLRHPLARRVPKAPVVWLSRNSMWVYLWHIPAVHHLQELGELLPLLANHWPLRGLLLLASGLVGVVLQQALVRTALRVCPWRGPRFLADLLGVRGS